jgi:hypothetical protein
MVCRHFTFTVMRPIFRAMSSSTLAGKAVSNPLEEEFHDGQAEVVLRLTGAELAVCVATEIMDWRLENDGSAGSWHTAQGEPAGYYYGRPFRPHRDRNALALVWERIEQLQLREAYMEQLLELISLLDSPTEQNGLWSFHVVDPRLASCAALLAVRDAQMRKFAAVI